MQPIVTVTYDLSDVPSRTELLDEMRDVLEDDRALELVSVTDKGSETCNIVFVNYRRDYAVAIVLPLRKSETAMTVRITGQGRRQLQQRISDLVKKLMPQKG